MAKEKQEKQEKQEKKPKQDPAVAAAPEKKGAKKEAKETAAPAEKKAAAPKVKAPPARLKDKYRHEILPMLLERNGYKNPMAVPKLKKIVLNMGVGEANKNIKVLDSAADELGKITGQKAVIRRAKKAISSFKLREGMPIGATVTLRGDIMYEFLDRLISVALPRVRDFKGLSPDSFDGRGNYTIGLKDQLIFPEIDYAKVDKMRGMNVTFVTSARSDEEARTLLLHMGLPFRKN